MGTNLEEINYKVKAIKKRNPSVAEAAQWMGDLLSETIRVAEKFCAPEFNLDPEHLADACSNGKPLLDLSKLPLDWEQIGALFKRLLKLVESREEGRKQAGGLRQALAKDQENSHRLMKAILSSDFQAIEATALELDVTPSVLILFLRMSLRPTLLKAARAALDFLDINDWPHGHCPVCGSAPKLGDLSGEGGKRRLHCTLCETTWPYPRLRCPFCENDNPEKLSYVHAENEVGLRVDVCSNCGLYIKTIDLRETAGPVIVPLDDLATWHLDLIASRDE
jgi:FdhE protein